METLENNKNYEIGFLLKPEKDRQNLITSLINHQMSINKESQISRIKLAYPIKKENFAYFGSIYFSGNPENIKKLTEDLKHNSQILRFIIVSKPIYETSPEQPPPIPYFQSQKVKSISEEKLNYSESAESKKQLLKKSQKPEELSNEDLEKKLEEILK